MSIFDSREEKERQVAANAEAVWRNGWRQFDHSRAAFASRGYEMSNGTVFLTEPVDIGVHSKISSLLDLDIDDSSDFVLLTIIKLQLLEAFQGVRPNRVPHLWEWKQQDSIPEPGYGEAAMCLGSFSDAGLEIKRGTCFYYFVPSFNISKQTILGFPKSEYFSHGLLPMHIYRGSKLRKEIISHIRIAVGLNSQFELVWICRHDLSGNYDSSDMINPRELNLICPQERLKPYGLFGSFPKPSSDSDEIFTRDRGVWPHRELLRSPRSDQVK